VDKYNSYLIRHYSYSMVTLSYVYRPFKLSKMNYLLLLICIFFRQKEFLCQNRILTKFFIYLMSLKEQHFGNARERSEMSFNTNSIVFINHIYLLDLRKNAAIHLRTTTCHKISMLTVLSCNRCNWQCNG